MRGGTKWKGRFAVSRMAQNDSFSSSLLTYLSSLSGATEEVRKANTTSEKPSRKGSYLSLRARAEENFHAISIFTHKRMGEEGSPRSPFRPTSCSLATRKMCRVPSERAVGGGALLRAGCPLASLGALSLLLLVHIVFSFF